MTEGAETVAKVRPVVHARYLAWAGRACSLVNRTGSEIVMDRWSLDLHLFEWSICEGLIDKPDKMCGPMSMHVAVAFDRDPEAVKGEARRYYRRKIPS